VGRRRRRVRSLPTRLDQEEEEGEEEGEGENRGDTPPCVVEGSMLKRSLRRDEVERSIRREEEEGEGEQGESPARQDRQAAGVKAGKGAGKGRGGAREEGARERERESGQSSPEEKEGKKDEGPGDVPMVVALDPNKVELRQLSVEEIGKVGHANHYVEDAAQDAM
jgi:hypothetical protein